MFTSGCLFNFSASIQNRYCIFPSVDRALNCAFISSHVDATSSQSNHSASGPCKTEPKRAFLRSSYTVWMLFSKTAGPLPNEKLIFFSSKRIKAVGSSLESVPINFSNAMSGYATVFTVFYITKLVAPNLFNYVLFATKVSLHVALTRLCSFVYRLTVVEV